MITAIIQARTGSTRLPGKVLVDIEGKPMLVRVIERVKEARTIAKIVVATTTRFEDWKLCKIAIENGVDFYIGSEGDVLDRYYRAATFFNANPIVRITSDCPLIDPDVVDKTIDFFLNGSFDYVTTTGIYPDGLDVEVFSYLALERAWKEAKEPYDREHVTPYILKHPNIFRLDSVLDRCVLGSNEHWSVDTAGDLEFVRWVYKKLGSGFSIKDILRIVK